MGKVNGDKPTPPRLFPNAVGLAHQLVAAVLQPGDTAIDATAGKGRDALWLARCVAPGGKVYAFDIQLAALEQSQQLLAGEGMAGMVTLIEAGHQQMRKHVPESVQAIMFNLGYLPGGNHQVITRPATTLAALEQGMELLLPGGLITMIAYPGHPGGMDEGQALEARIKRLSRQQWDAVRWEFAPGSDRAPYLLALQRRANRSDE